LSAPPRPEVSIVLPTYQESATILRVLGELRTSLRRAGVEAEVLVVDDASPDGTADLVAEHDPATRVIRRTHDRGLAPSVRDGIAAARAPVTVVMDSDFNHDPKLVPSLLKYLDDFELISGSRFAPGGGMYSRVRQTGSFVMNIIIRVVLQTQIQDNLAGFFAARTERLLELPRDAIFRGHGEYYFRLLYVWQRRGLSVLEIPVVYRSREGGGSKTPLLRTFVRYTAALLRFRLVARSVARRPPLQEPGIVESAAGAES